MTNGNVNYLWNLLKNKPFAIVYHIINQVCLCVGDSRLWLCSEGAGAAQTETLWKEEKSSCQPYTGKSAALNTYLCPWSRNEWRHSAVTCFTFLVFFVICNFLGIKANKRVNINVNERLNSQSWSWGTAYFGGCGPSAPDSTNQLINMPRLGKAPNCAGQWYSRTRTENPE